MVAATGSLPVMICTPFTTEIPAAGAALGRANTKKAARARRLRTTLLLSVRGGRI
jgi:hypothetical protein